MSDLERIEQEIDERERVRSKRLNRLLAIFLGTFLLALVMALMLCGCGDRQESRFKLIDYGDWYNVYVDLETGVEYIRRGGEIEPLLDSYGRPYIYPAFDAREDRLP